MVGAVASADTPSDLQPDLKPDLEPGDDPAPDRDSLRRRLHTVIFEADTPGGKAFDVALLLAIAVSVAAVFLESVPSIRAEYGPLLRRLEWVLTILFTIEYVLRLLCVDKPLRYARSFYGVVDLLAILPTYLLSLIHISEPTRPSKSSRMPSSA